MTTAAGPAGLPILGLSHELRAPVGAIALAAAALRRATGEAERDCLLDVSRLQAGEVRARPVACAPGRLAADAVAAAAPALDGAAVDVVVGRRCPAVLADPFLTERILVNLLHNAARHGAPPVRLRAVACGRGVDLIVSDAGPGVDPARARSLFRTSVAPSASGGLGVGLRLSHGLAAAQGADLRMVAVPRGACFALRLRAAEASFAAPS